MGEYKRYQFNLTDHLAGIVPIGGPALDFNMPWHDCLIPIAPDYLAIERAVYECAVAGCDTIWITGHKGSTPLIRKRVGDFITDPVSLTGKHLWTRRRDIPIFYVPINPKDHDKRDCLGWSVLHGADSAFRVSAFISKWTISKRYYCAFPYGVLPEEFIRDYRERLREEKRYIFSYNGKTVKDGLHISFTFDSADYKYCRDIIKKKNISDWEERKSKDATEFTLSEVFNPLDWTDCPVVELPWFHDISSWNNYCNYTASEHSKILKKPTYLFLKDKRKLFPTEKDFRDEQESRANLQQNSTTDEGKS